MNHCKHVHTEETIPSEYFPTFYTGFIFRYNEEGSDIWNDANTLERVLMTKVKELAIEQPNLVSLKKTISAVGKMYSSLAFLLPTPEAVSKRPL